MPDTIRAWRLTADEAVPDHESTRHLPPCVVVTGRTAQEIEDALRQYDGIRAWQERVIAEDRRLRDA